MKRQNILLSLLILLMDSCVSNMPIEIKICEKLYKENVGTSLVLYISEGSCAECINVEFQNLVTNEELIDSLVIVGAFSKQRYFDACVNSIAFNKPLKKVFIDRSELKGVKIKSNLFYFVYQKSLNYSSAFSNVFYPEACMQDLTVKYYLSAKNKISGKNNFYQDR
jgi:hypothetical protein